MGKKQIKHFFIDYENVGDNFLHLLSEKEQAVVYFFYSDSRKQVNLDSLAQLAKLGAETHFLKAKVTGTKNALDFQLVAYLGYKIKEFPEDRFVIVSKDKGFDSAIAFFAERRIAIERQSPEERLADVVVNQDDELMALVAQASDKSDLHTKLVKKFGQEKGNMLYHQFKQSLSSKK